MEVVIVTGGSGFIGRPVVRRLAQDFRIVGFDRAGWPHLPREAECVCIDLTSDAETRPIPKALAKAVAWLEDQVPGEEPVIKPWMIDLADEHYALDIGRARTILGWEPKRSLRETLPRMVSALKGDPLQFYKKNKLEAPSSLEQSVVSIEIASLVLKARDPETRQPLVDLILDHAEQKGTGRWTAQAALDLGVPIPAMSASLVYFDGYRSAVLPQNLTQAQRDLFGAHTYQRVDRPDAGPVHTDWRRLVDGTSHPSQET